MGNFKHHSSRTGDRDRNGEGERDAKDKDGLRHVCAPFFLLKILQAKANVILLSSLISMTATGFHFILLE
jgi:hypothetical protein